MTTPPLHPNEQMSLLDIDRLYYMYDPDDENHLVMPSKAILDEIKWDMDAYEDDIMEYKPKDLLKALKDIQTVNLYRHIYNNPSHPIDYQLIDKFVAQIEMPLLTYDEVIKKYVTPFATLCMQPHMELQVYGIMTYEKKEKILNELRRQKLNVTTDSILTGYYYCIRVEAKDLTLSALIKTAKTLSAYGNAVFIDPSTLQTGSYPSYIQQKRT